MGTGRPPDKDYYTKRLFFISLGKSYQMSKKEYGFGDYPASHVPLLAISVARHAHTCMFGLYLSVLQRGCSF